MPQSVTGVRLWSDTLDKLRELQALVTLSTGKRVNMTELVHRLVTEELERTRRHVDGKESKGE